MSRRLLICKQNEFNYDKFGKNRFRLFQICYLDYFDRLILREKISFEYFSHFEHLEYLIEWIL